MYAHSTKILTLILLYTQDSEIHVTFEDQQKINRFAKHNARLDDLRDELNSKKNDMKSIEEACDEIELFDEDEQIPFVVGEIFISHNLSKTQVGYKYFWKTWIVLIINIFKELLAEAKQQKLDEIKEIEENCKQLQGLMAELKAQLYHRFGNNIYLENEE